MFYFLARRKWHKHDEHSDDRNDWKTLFNATQECVLLVVLCNCVVLYTLHCYDVAKVRTRKRDLGRLVSSKTTMRYLSRAGEIELCWCTGCKSCAYRHTWSQRTHMRECVQHIELRLHMYIYTWPVHGWHRLLWAAVFWCVRVSGVSSVPKRTVQICSHSGWFGWRFSRFAMHARLSIELVFSRWNIYKAYESRCAMIARTFRFNGRGNVRRLYALDARRDAYQWCLT